MQHVRAGCQQTIRTVMRFLPKCVWELSIASSQDRLFINATACQHALQFLHEASGAAFLLPMLCDV
eukprot:1153698-Pelagomonas_calceolata.AAC.3